MRRGVSCALALVLLLGALPMGPFLWQEGTLVAAEPVNNPGTPLTVSDTRVVTDHEVWGEVKVASTGRLMVQDGGRLLVDRLLLEGNAILSVTGGVLEVAPTHHVRATGITGTCSELTVADRSIIRIRGPDGGYDVPTSSGGSVAFNVTCSRAIKVSDSLIDMRGGDGLTVPETLTEGDLGGRAFAGGDVDISLVSTNPEDMVWIVASDILLRAGAGGDAPDAEAPPPDHEGRMKGLGGGFTRGGEVRDRVGSGGDVGILFEGRSVEVSNTKVNVSAGDGGDAGDGATVNTGVQAGGGGGGYSGGDGASGLGQAYLARPGGSVIGDVGRGGDIAMSIVTDHLDLRTTRFDMVAGDGGMAGSGGPSSGLGGGGGGGYSGGGGGSHWYMDGAAGGEVMGDVGRGGHVTAAIQGDDDAEIKSSRFWLYGGRGGDAGHGGAGGRSGGGGGGGLSGGGGGGSGDTGGSASGRSGGGGGWVSGKVAMGGTASLAISSDRLISISSLFDVEGGMGGMGGLPGPSYVLPDGSWTAGGGAGGHSAGGGGGAGYEGNPGGHGGTASSVTGDVGDGGDGAFDVRSERPSLHANTIAYTKWGARGVALNGSAQGAAGGASTVRDTFEGRVTEHIPMSEPLLWAPADEEYVSYPPRFDWMPVYRSTTNGGVDHYLFQLDDDQWFTDLVVEDRVPNPGWKDPDLPMGTYYWKVIAVYTEGMAQGPVPPFNWFRYFNAPPVIMREPTIEVDEDIAKSVYVGNFVFDPDTSLSSLCLTCEHHGVQSITGLFVTFMYPEYEPPHEVKYWVSDGNSNVSGVINVVVIDANERPVIVSVGNQRPPLVNVTMMEGEDLTLWVNAHDPNGDPINYSLLGTWEGANMSRDGFLDLTATREDIGMHIVSVKVADPMGAVDTAKVRIFVVNAKEPPGPVEVFGPKDGTRWKEGDTIMFTVEVSDPDIVHGEVLNVTWTSNVSGFLGTVGTTRLASLPYNRLPAGDHRISINVSDGLYESNAHIDITVTEREEPGPPPESSNLWLYVVFAIIFVVMIAVGYYAGTRGDADGP